MLTDYRFWIASRVHQQLDTISEELGQLLALLNK